MYRGHCTNMQRLWRATTHRGLVRCSFFFWSLPALIMPYWYYIYCLCFVCAGAVMKQIMTCWLLKDKGCGNNFSIIPARPKQAASFPQNIVQSLTTYPKVRCVYTSAGWTVMNRNHTLWFVCVFPCLLLHSSIRLIVLLYSAQQSTSRLLNHKSKRYFECGAELWSLQYQYQFEACCCDGHLKQFILTILFSYIVVSLTVLRGKQFVTKLN